MIKPHTPVLVLACYMFAVAIAALVRTGSVTPLIIAGSFALITLIVALAARRSGKLAMNLAIGWVSIVFLVESYMAIFDMQSHGPAREGRSAVFGSVAILALIALILMIILKRRQERKRQAAK